MFQCFLLNAQKLDTYKIDKLQNSKIHKYKIHKLQNKIQRKTTFMLAHPFASLGCNTCLAQMHAMLRRAMHKRIQIAMCNAHISTKEYKVYLLRRAMHKNTNWKVKCAQKNTNDTK